VEQETMEQRAQPEPQGASAVAETRVQRPAPADRRGMPRAALQSVRQSKDLFVPHDHPAAAVRERTELIARRVRLFAGLFAVLTLAWIPVDAYTIRWPYWGDL
jgi:hypothetical protein